MKQQKKNNLKHYHRNKNIGLLIIAQHDEQNNTMNVMFNNNKKNNTTYNGQKVRFLYKKTLRRQKQVIEILKYQGIKLDLNNTFCISKEMVNSLC